MYREETIITKVELLSLIRHLTCCTAQSCYKSKNDFKMPFYYSITLTIQPKSQFKVRGVDYACTEFHLLKSVASLCRAEEICRHPSAIGLFTGKFESGVRHDII